MLNKISNSQIQIKKTHKPSSYVRTTTTSSDSFVPSFCASPAKKPSLFKAIKNIFVTEAYKVPRYSDKEPTQFQLDLAEGIKASFEKEIPPQNFENIMSVEEFKEILPTLNEKNFKFDESFDENTLYNIDLDYQTLFSSRTGEGIAQILDKVEKHAEKYYEKTGKKFIFAIADKDNIYGLRHIVKKIGENPEKYKHFKFLPAIKLGYTHEAPTSQIGFENSEMLIYGINPFSKNLTNFINTTLAKRKKMSIDFIREIDKIYPDFSYNILEFAEQNRLLFNKDYTVSNLYWRIREYAEGKGGDSIKGKTEKPMELYQQVSNIMNGLGNNLFAEESFQETATNIEVNDENFNRAIKRIFEVYSTHVDTETGELVSTAENTFKEIIDCLNEEKTKPILAFASPIYLSHYFEEKGHNGDFENVLKFMKKTINESNGMICAFESVSPVCEQDYHIQKEQIDKFNNFIRENTNLYEVGGTMQNQTTT